MDVRTIYILIVGVVLGVALGPPGLGRFAPQWREAIFGGSEARQAIREFDEQTGRQLERLLETGVTPAAVEEFRRRRQAQRRSREASFSADRLERFQRQSGRAQAVVVALLALALLEALTGPGRRWTTFRSALLALWLSLVLAEPSLLAEVPWLFAASLVALAAAFGLIGARRDKPGEAERSSDPGPPAP